MRKEGENVRVVSGSCSAVITLSWAVHSQIVVLRLAVAINVTEGNKGRSLCHIAQGAMADMATLISRKRRSNCERNTHISRARDRPNQCNVDVAGNH